MSFWLKLLKTDQKTNPVPQYFNDTSDDYEIIKGSNNAPFSQVIAAVDSSVITLQNAAGAVGVGIVLPTAGYGVSSLAISGTFVATITFEGQGPDGNWYPINARLRGAGSIAATTTSTGLYEINCLGLTAVRANITAYTSGNVTVKGQAQPLTPTSDTVQLTGSNVPDTAGMAVKQVNKMSISTILNAQSVAAGGNTGFVSLGLDGTESLVAVTFAIDQQPWTANAYNLFNGFSTKNLYPEINGKTTTPGASNPAASIYVPLLCDGVAVPADYKEAVALAKYTNGGQIRVINSSASTATITVKVIRMWGR